jgi:UDP-glucose 4-epimerase
VRHHLTAGSRIVVTGATGNVGSVLTERLARAGHNVIGIARRPPRSGLPDGVSWCALDLTTDRALPCLHNVMRGADAVVHLAWGFQPSHRPEQLEELGIGGTRRVAEVAIAQRVPHLVHMSSVGVYSPRVDDRPVTEDFPRDGVRSSPYSRHKAAAEKLLDTVEAFGTATTLTRLRPGIIGQRAAGSALLRYGVPGYVPAVLLRHLPLLPLDRRLSVPLVHTEDVVDVVLRVLHLRPTGAFNLSTDSALTADDVARAFSAHRLHVPAPALRTAVSAAWHVRLLQLDPGWIDLAFAAPLLDWSRARSELDWSPRWSTDDVIQEVVDGLVTRSSAPTPVLRRRGAADVVRRAFGSGPVHARREP